MPYGRHSAKFEFFLKKISLPSALCPALDKVWIFFLKFLCRVPTRETLGKDFLFFLKKILCRVPTRKALGKELLFFLKNFFAECQPNRHSTKCFYFLKKKLPSASHRALGKRFSFFLNFFAKCQPGRHSTKIFCFFLNFFAECPMDVTRQSFEFFLKKNSLTSALWPALGKVWIFF